MWEGLLGKPWSLHIFLLLSCYKLPPVNCPPNHWAAASMQRSHGHWQVEASPCGGCLAGTSRRLAACWADRLSHPRAGEVTVVLLRVPCPCFSEETPSDLLALWLPFPPLALASVQGPGVEVRGGHPGRVGRGENGLAGGRGERL